MKNPTITSHLHLLAAMEPINVMEWRNKMGRLDRETDQKNKWLENRKLEFNLLEFKRSEFKIRGLELLLFLLPVPIYLSSVWNCIFLEFLWNFLFKNYSDWWTMSRYPIHIWMVSSLHETQSKILLVVKKIRNFRVDPTNFTTEYDGSKYGHKYWC